MGVSSSTSGRPVALLDVDHTLVFGIFGGGEAAVKLNLSLLAHLTKANILDVFLFTDMTFSSSAVAERRELTAMLEARGFKVHGVITPCDVVWNGTTEKEASLLHKLCTEDGVYRGKFYGEEFEKFVLSRSEELPALALAVTSYAPQANKPGQGFSEVAKQAQEADQGGVSRGATVRSMIAKAIADHLSVKLGYAHCKGLMLDLFLQQLPAWVNSIVVCDDHEKVNECVNGFRPVDPATQVPVLTMIRVEAIDMDPASYTCCLESHFQRLKNRPSFENKKR